MEPGLKYWRCTKCDHAEACEPQDDYEVGDSEPCIYCDDLSACAVVEQGAVACEIVGSSPAEMDR